MSTIRSRVDVDRISAEAREIELGRTILTFIAVALYALGWIAAKLVLGIWFVLAWTFAAIRLGWRDARASSAAHRVRRQVGPA